MRGTLTYSPRKQIWTDTVRLGVYEPGVLPPGVSREYQTSDTDVNAAAGPS
jgi:hypothetical protein